MPEKQENVVFVGKKPNMSYVLAAVTQFSAGQREVHIKARGRAISKAVDVVEIIRNKFVPDAKIADIKISTEQVALPEGKAQKGKESIGVSTIELVLKK